LNKDKIFNSNNKHEITSFIGNEEKPQVLKFSSIHYKVKTLYAFIIDERELSSSKHI
jgi:hypothetical protein